MNGRGVVGRHRYRQGHGRRRRGRGPKIQALNPIQARLFLPFKGPRGVFRDPLMISGIITASPMKLCTVIVLLKAYQNTKRNFEIYEL